MKRALKWFAVAAATLLALGLVATAIGLVLPVEHTARVSAVLEAPVEDVWALVSDLGASAAWRQGVDRIERLPDDEGRPVFREVSGMGALDLRVDASDPPTRMVTRIVGEDLPFGGTWTYELASAPAGTRLTITEEGQVHNPFFRFASRFIFGHYGTLEDYLESLGRRLGHTVEITRG